MDVEKLKDVFRLARLAALASNNSEKVCEINDFRNETIAALTTLQSREATLIRVLREVADMASDIEGGLRIIEHISRALTTSEKEQ
jgi:hypothetical protein